MDNDKLAKLFGSFKGGGDEGDELKPSGVVSKKSNPLLYQMLEQAMGGSKEMPPIEKKIPMKPEWQEQIKKRNELIDEEMILEQKISRLESKKKAIMADLWDKIEGDIGYEGHQMQVDEETNELIIFKKE